MIKNYVINGIKLDKYQLEIINCNTDMLVIAGAGSGKTITMIAKINYLIENKICSESEILVISFTNASVDDIKKKINSNIDVYTFHKLALKILNKYSYSICSSNLLLYIIKEYLMCCNNYEQNNILKYLKLNITYQKFLNSNYFNSLCNLILSFINLYKTNNLNINNIRNIKFRKKEKKIITIIFKIYNIYLQEKKSQNLLDFDDLIINATNYVKYSNIKYKYIIIDEFQDTSLIRLNLIKEIYNYTKSKIIVVGDDYQSIYRFSGCDLNIFLNFKSYFPNAKQLLLVNTYRNPLKLIKITSSFITKNPLQIKKIIKSNKYNDNPIILCPYKNKVNILKKVLNIISNYSKDIMILSRNNNDIYNYIDKDFTINENIINYKDYYLKYYTVHKSKGLEAEYVIVLNCNDEYLGFPNKIENNSLITKLFPDNEIKYAEERRLFYVALTRCKKEVYLLYNKNNPSIFIKEIKRIIKKTK